MEKLLAMNIAAILAGAVISNLKDDLTVDVDIKNDSVRAENLMVWELFRIFYHAIKGAAEDEQNWPTPKVNLQNLLENASQSLQGILQGNPVVQQLLQKLIGAIPVPAPLPDPGKK